MNESEKLIYDFDVDINMKFVQWTSRLRVRQIVSWAMDLSRHVVMAAR